MGVAAAVPLGCLAAADPAATCKVCAVLDFSPAGHSHGNQWQQGYEEEKSRTWAPKGKTAN